MFDWRTGVLIGGLACAGILLPLAEVRAESPCAAGLPPSKLTVFDAKSVIVEKTVSERELLEFQKSLRGHLGDRFLLADTPVHGGFVVEHRIVPGMGDPKSFCDAPSVVRIALGYGPRIIYMTPELARDECVRDALRAHEAEHSQMENDGLGSFIDDQTALLKALMTKLKTTPARSPDLAKAQFEAAGLPIIRDLERRLLVRKEELRQRVDHPTGLAKVANECGGRVGSFHDGHGQAI
ncbi:MAG: hypothetical protein J0H14_06585 [Alphaproteobacteria bacterium]|nr:hypothetical protein [Alphaproteobacteria bacterium]